MLFREAILWSDRVSVRVTMAAKQGGYGFALHIKHCSTESGPTQTSVLMGEVIAENYFKCLHWSTVYMGNDENGFCKTLDYIV